MNCCRGRAFASIRLYLTSFDTTPIHYSDGQGRRFYKELLTKMRLAPGVRSAALVSGIPLLDAGVVSVVPEGYTLPPKQESITKLRTST
jgi:hypothetical protein